MVVWLAYALFFLAALIYSSVGFGGGSSYLAILSASGVMEQAGLKATALLCNIVVVSNGTYQYYKEGWLDLKKVAPIALCSVPMAYLGGQMKLSDAFYFNLLGAALVVSGLLLILDPRRESAWFSKQTAWFRHGFSVASGAGIGLLSGMVGIGGGIFLAPLLHLIRWDTAKSIAAMSSFFILVNSISGLAGQLSKNANAIPWSDVAPFAAIVFVGGFIGSKLSIHLLKPLWIKRITGVLVFLVGLEILLK